MSEPDARSGHLPGACDARALADDWETICRSEAAAFAVDPEAYETWHAVLAVWATAAVKLLQPLGSPTDDRHRAASDAASRPATAAAAPDARDAEIERLAARVDQLERRMAGDGGPALDG